jgi:hypothetical protein
MLPPPTTFAEGMRKAFGVAAVFAGIAFGLAVLVGASIVVFGDWGPAQIRLQLYILGALVGAGTIGTMIVTIGLLVGGPVGRVKAKADRSGFDIEAEGDSEK